MHVTEVQAPTASVKVYITYIKKNVNIDTLIILCRLLIPAHSYFWFHDRISLSHH